MNPRDASQWFIAAASGGVWKTNKAGISWAPVFERRHLPLPIDPRDSNLVWVAAQGPLWGPGGDRGLYKRLRS